MTPKKNPGANLENKRGFFFLFGLAIAILAAIVAFQYKSHLKAEQLTERPAAGNDDTVIPITVTKLEKPPAKPEKAKPRPKDPAYIEPVDDNDDLPLDENDWLGPDDSGEEPVDIGFAEEDPEPIPIGVLKNVARPTECGEFNDVDEQKDCLNLWIQRYIVRNTQYPGPARRMSLEDKVFVSFVVSPDGDITDVKVVRGEYDVLNAEAVRVVKSVPDFIPARQLGRPVPMSMTVPVSFKLSGY